MIWDQEFLLYLCWRDYKRSRAPQESRLPSTVPPCRFFKLGRCMYGENCRFLHEQDTPDTSSDVALLNWVNAPEFVPSWLPAPAVNDPSEFPPVVATGRALCRANAADSPDREAGTQEPGPSSSQDQPLSYAKAVDPNAGQCSRIKLSNSELCPYYLLGHCGYGDECPYLHGDLCELCNQFCLHPTDEAQRTKHNKDCMLQHELDMERSFAIARSRDKACGVCMEVIWEKVPATKQRFGLLPNCSHCFCLDCIRKWRQEKQFDNKIIRSCPECRVQSDFVCPSRYWCETKEEKEKLITDYKKALSNKACKYFNQGQGECPFGNRCFYLHALPDGTKADVGPPQGKLRRRRIGQDEEEAEFFRVLLWDFLEERESRYVVQLGLDLEDLDLYGSDSDDYFSDEPEAVFFFH